MDANDARYPPKYYLLHLGKPRLSLMLLLRVAMIRFGEQNESRDQAQAHLCWPLRLGIRPHSILIKGLNN